MEVATHKSLKEVYVEECTKVGCKKNSELMRTLPDRPGDYESLQRLDLNLNCVGQKGIQALLNVIALSPNLKALLLADNFLTNDSVKDLLSILSGHPSVTHVDLSRNPISHVAGKMLSSYVSTHPHVTDLLLDDTLINPALVKIIERKAEANFKKSSQRKEEVPEKPKELKEESEKKEQRPKENIPAEAKPKEPEVKKVEETGKKSVAVKVQETAAQPEPSEQTGIVHLQSIFNLCEQERSADFTHLQLLSVVASRVYPNVTPVSARSKPVEQETAATTSPVPECAVPEPVPEPATADVQELQVAEDDEWYGVKLLFNASQQDADEEQWYGIRSVYAAVEKEAGQTPEPSSAKKTEKQDLPITQPTRRQSIMDPTETIVLKGEDLRPLEILKAVSPPSAVGVIDFLLQSKDFVQEDNVAQRKEKDDSPPVLRNLDLLFDTAAKSPEDMSGLDYLKKSMSLLLRNGGVSPSEEEEEEEEEEDTPKPSARTDWYAMDLIWTIANTNASGTDWTALASVMSIINKD